MLAGLTLRQAAALVLVLVVGGLHLALAEQVLESRLGEGAGKEASLKRFDIAFVRQLQAQTPAPAAVAVPRPPVQAQAVRASTPAASAPLQSPPEVQASKTEPELHAAAEVAPQSVNDADTEPRIASVTSQVVSDASRLVSDVGNNNVAPGASAVASTGQTLATFDWPPSTRLSYVLTGHFQGPVDGQAQVEWLRSGARYQVHLDVSVGPSFAPLVRRRMSSEGELAEGGLQPVHYEEETRVLLNEPRRLRMQFSALNNEVRLANGQPVAGLPGVQDTASQFVQLTWLFNTHPQRLQSGERIAVPLALPRRVGQWTYEVVGEERLATPVGELPTWHLRPVAGSQKPGELVAEAWFAPGLQYLPVRIMIRQDAQTHVDLLLKRLPLQAER